MINRNSIFFIINKTKFICRYIINMNNSFDIEQFLSLDSYATEERVSRRKGSGGSQEFFTPFELVKRMSDKVSEDQWNNTESNFLEPSFGNGNFVIYIIYNKIQHGSTWQQALEHTYGTELMQDNVIETHERILEMLSKLNIDYNVDTAKSILNNNLVCTDFFKWDYENWCPIKENKCEALF